MEEKIKGLKKMGLGISAITALVVKVPEFDIAILITIIAITGILCQSILDGRKT